MLLEHREASPSVEPKKPSRHVMFIAGLLGTNAGLNAEMGLGQGLGAHYGIENVTMFNSAVSTDRSNPRRFEEMADVITSHAKTGLDIAVHSLGASELRRVIKKIRKDDPTYFDDPQVKENLRFVLIAPSGFNKGLKERAAYIRGYFHLDTPAGKGLSAVAAFPPENIAPADLVLAADLSNKAEGIPVFPFKGRDNKEFLTPEELDKLSMYDSELQDAVNTSNSEDTRRIVTARGEYVKDALQQVYAGSPTLKEKGRIRMTGRVGLGLLFRAVGNKPMQEFQRLAADGYRVDFLVPEYDLIVPLPKVLKFFNDEQQAKEHITVIEGTNHQAIALQPEMHGAAIKASGWAK